jgi:hypothetical protein
MSFLTHAWRALSTASRLCTLISTAVARCDWFGFSGEAPEPRCASSGASDRAFLRSRDLSRRRPVPSVRGGLNPQSAPERTPSTTPPSLAEKINRVRTGDVIGLRCCLRERDAAVTAFHRLAFSARCEEPARFGCLLRSRLKRPQTLNSTTSALPSSFSKGSQTCKERSAPAGGLVCSAGVPTGDSRRWRQRRYSEDKPQSLKGINSALHGQEPQKEVTVARNIFYL